MIGDDEVNIFPQSGYSPVRNVRVITYVPARPSEHPVEEIWLYEMELLQEEGAIDAHI